MKLYESPFLNKDDAGSAIPATLEDDDEAGSSMTLCKLLETGEPCLTNVSTDPKILSERISIDFGLRNKSLLKSPKSKSLFVVIPVTLVCFSAYNAFLRASS